MASGAKPGQRFGGRAKGTPNKKTERVADMFKRMKFDPFEIMAAFAMNDRTKLKLKPKDPDIPYEIRTRMANECAKYIKPQLKAMQVQDEDGNDLVKMFADAVAGKL